MIIWEIYIIMLGRCIRRSTITASCSLIHRKIETPGVTFCLSDPPICFRSLHIVYCFLVGNPFFPSINQSMFILFINHI